MTLPHRQASLLIQAIHLLNIDGPAFSLQKNMDAPIAKAPPLASQYAYALSHLTIGIAFGFITQYQSR